MKDYEEEVTQKAIVGDAEAQCTLGWIFSGRGDDITAVIWYRKAADQGYAEAQSDLGKMYHYGKGVIQNDQQAVFWYRKAAEQGHATAKTDLEWMYSQGRGVTQDDKAAGDS